MIMAKKAPIEETPSEPTPAPVEETPTAPSEDNTPVVPRKDRPKKKTVAFDNAMKALGADAKPLQIQDWIRRQYGMMLKATLLSTYKGNWLRKHGRSGLTPRAGGIAGGVGGGKAATLSDVRDLKNMLSRVGVDQLKEMLTLLGVH
jgi:hypothetical protein